jgi:hypothetical protein
MPTLQPQDGNLIILDDYQLQAILDNCSHDVMQGRFGDVYTSKSVSIYLTRTLLQVTYDVPVLLRTYN